MGKVLINKNTFGDFYRFKVLFKQTMVELLIMSVA